MMPTNGAGLAVVLLVAVVLFVWAQRRSPSYAEVREIAREEQAELVAIGLYRQDCAEERMAAELRGRDCPTYEDWDELAVGQQDAYRTRAYLLNVTDAPAESRGRHL